MCIRDDEKKLFKSLCLLKAKLRKRVSRHIFPKKSPTSFLFPSVYQRQLRLSGKSALRKKSGKKALVKIFTRKLSRKFVASWKLLSHSNVVDANWIRFSERHEVKIYPQLYSVFYPFCVVRVECTLRNHVLWTFYHETCFAVVVIRFVVQW